MSGNSGRISIRLLLATLFLAAPTASAQQQPARGRGPAQRLETIADRIRQAAGELNLSDDQKSRIDAILATIRQDFRQTAQQLMQADPPTRRQRFIALFDELKQKIKPILTDSQALAFEQKLAEIRQEQGLGPGRGPATQPVDGVVPPRFGVVVERLNDYVSQLGLNDVQKEQTQKLFVDTRQQVQELRQEAQASMDAVGQKMQTLVQGLRQDLAGILSPQQLEKLRELIADGAPMEGPRAGRGGRGRGPGAMMPPPMQPDAMAGPAITAAVQPVEVDAPMLEVGKPAPDFTLKRLEGQNVQLSAFKGKLVLLVFGSYSSPSFRQRAAQLEKLKQDYNNRVYPFIIYTRENHPAGQWNVERNKDEKITVEQPANLDGRITLARQARGNLKLTVPIIMDTMEDTTAKTWAGTTNAAYLIGRDGNIIASQRWFEPYAMRNLIDEAIREAARSPDAAQN